MDKKNLCFKTAAITLGLVVSFFICELILMSIDWSPGKLASEYMQFGYTTGIPIWDEDGVLEESKPVQVKLFEHDPDLFWKPIPDTDFTNGQGFRGKNDVELSNAHHRVRILVIGDSCSFLGKKLYPDFLHEILVQNHPGVEFEIINASVPGYTSYQGEKRLARLIRYKPHYVCIYFGWNDHWILPSGYSDEFHGSLVKGFKVTRMVKILWRKISGQREYRVPVDAYRRNLELMMERLEGQGAIPILIIAPAGYRDHKMPEWAFKFYRQYYKMTADEIRDIPTTHGRYGQVAADVSKKHKSILVDPRKPFSRSALPTKRLFRNDLIHLRRAGHHIIAEEIYRQMIHYNAAAHISWDGSPRPLSAQ